MLQWALVPLMMVVFSLDTRPRRADTPSLRPVSGILGDAKDETGVRESSGLIHYATALKNKRRVYLVGFVVLFFLCVPVVLLFANGFRFEGGAGFVKTGGIYISVPYADAVVSMNGEEVGTSGLLKGDSILMT